MDFVRVYFNQALTAKFAINSLINGLLEQQFETMFLSGSTKFDYHFVCSERNLLAVFEPLSDSRYFVVDFIYLANNFSHFQIFTSFLIKVQLRLKN